MKTDVFKTEINPDFGIHFPWISKTPNASVSKVFQEEMVFAAEFKKISEHQYLKGPCHSQSACLCLCDLRWCMHICLCTRLDMEPCRHLMLCLFVCLHWLTWPLHRFMSFVSVLCIKLLSSWAVASLVLFEQFLFCCLMAMLLLSCHFLPLCSCCFAIYDAK